LHEVKRFLVFGSAFASQGKNIFNGFL